MLLLAPLRAVDLTLESALALASPAMLSLELKMAPLTIPRLRSCRSTCVPFRASRQCGFGRRLHGSDEDAASATSHTQSHMAEQFFVVGALRLLDLIPPPSLASRMRPLLLCLQLSGIRDWLFAVPISGLKQTLNGHHFRALMRYRLCTQLSSLNFTCLSFGTTIDIYGDHALICRGDPCSWFRGLRPSAPLGAAVLGHYSSPSGDKSWCGAKSAMTPLSSVVVLVCPGLQTSSFTHGVVTSTVAWIWSMCHVHAVVRESRLLF